MERYFLAVKMSFDFVWLVSGTGIQRFAIITVVTGSNATFVSGCLLLSLSFSKSKANNLHSIVTQLTVANAL
jgi:hypothetical protein